MNNENIRVYTQRYITKDGTIKICPQRCKFTPTGRNRGRPKKDLSNFNKNDIMEFLKNNSVKNTCLEFGISPYILKKIQDK